jgi:PAS domain S-box-containing protein
MPKLSSSHASNAAAYLAAIVESSDDAIIGKNLEGIITSWNPAAERIFGYTADEVIGQPVTIIVLPEHQAQEKVILEQLKRGERIDHYETVRVAKDGRKIQLSVTISPIYNDKGEIIGASNISRDITLQKETEAKLKEQAEILVRNNRELADIAYIASHDLKEPLRGIIMKASFLLEDYGSKLDEDGVNELKSLVALSHRSYQLINDLLNISRVGKSPVQLEEIDPNEIIADITQTLEVTLKERHAKVIIVKKLPRILADRKTVAETFRNLIVNAVTYNNKPEPRIEIGYLPEKESREKLEKDVFYVKDNGIGIDLKFQDEVFRLFKRMETSKTYNPHGTGMGLTLVKKMIEKCDGHIWFESELGKGSTFYFSLGHRCEEQAQENAD